MNSAALQRMLLQARLSLARHGWGNMGALILLVVSALAWKASALYWQSQDTTQQRTLAAARASLESERQQLPSPSSRPHGNRARLATFYDLLGDGRYEEQQIKTLFDIAAKNGLTLDQADYKLELNKAGGYQTYQITLPVRGAYRSVRAFCEQTLLAIPFASLDRIALHRDTINSADVEARLRFTLFLDIPKAEEIKPSTPEQEFQP